MFCNGLDFRGNLLNRSEHIDGLVSVTIPQAESSKMAHFIAFFASAPLVSYPLIIPQEHVAMISEVHVMHVTRHVERSEPQRKSLPIEIVTNQRDALYAPPK